MTSYYLDISIVYTKLLSVYYLSNYNGVTLLNVFIIIIALLPLITLLLLKYYTYYLVISEILPHNYLFITTL